MILFFNLNLYSSALATQQLIASGRSLPIAFSVGFSDSADLENARIVANYLRIPHRVLVIKSVF